MKIVFEMVTNRKGSHRAKYDGAEVTVTQRVDSFAGGVGCYLAYTEGGEEFGAYGDELILVPDAKPGDVFSCPSCGATDSWREWSQDWYCQSVSVIVGSDGKAEIEEYHGDGEHGDGGGEGAYLTCRACDNDVELAPAPVPVDMAAMDRIRGILSGERWSADHLEWIAEVVVSTGRVIDEPGDETYSPISG